MEGARSNRKLYMLLHSYNDEMNWANRKKLDKATIETLFREIDGIDRLGEAYSAEEVAYPVTGVDVVDAVRYILEKDVVGSFVHFLDACNAQEFKPTHIEYEIPLADRTQHGRSTPRMLFSLSPNTDDSMSGRLYHSYGGLHEIVSFLGIPTNNTPTRN